MGGCLLNEYEKLIDEAEKEGLKIYELDFESNAKGLIYNNIVGINKNINTVNEKRCILAEELGHYHKNTGDILDLSILENIKQENKARRWSYEKLISLEAIIDAYEANCSTRYELAEFLNVTIEFLEDTIKFYRQRYGVFVNVKDSDYTIIFEPSLAVFKKL